MSEFKLELGIRDDLAIEYTVEGLSLPERQDADVAEVNRILHEAALIAIVGTRIEGPN
jgi:hypothetical protein